MDVVPSSNREPRAGLFFKRAEAAELTLGDAIHCRDRYASVRGY